jgi:hypothetical protein
MMAASRRPQKRKRRAILPEALIFAGWVDVGYVLAIEGCDKILEGGATELKSETECVRALAIKCRSWLGESIKVVQPSAAGVSSLRARIADLMEDPGKDPKGAGAVTLGARLLE